MIFDGRSVHEISDEEIDGLVNNHVSERQHLEFKATVNYKDDPKRLELLHDIASFANGGGGYVIIGIRDDGNGKAQKYEPEMVGDVEAMKKSISSLCLDHISERIEGIEIVSREVKGNPLVIVRVPDSARKPHMVTYQNRTDFYTRYHDGKREMKREEIKEAFQKDEVGRRLTGIESGIRDIKRGIVSENTRNRIREEIESGRRPSLLSIEEGSQLHDIAYRLFLGDIGAKPYFWMGVTPEHPKPNLLDVDSSDIRQIINNPPGSRPNGWSMEDPNSPIERFGGGIYRGNKDFRYLLLLENDHMEFWTPLDDHFCWRQSDEEFKRLPRLYPYPLTEYPATFLRLYRALIDKAGIDDSFMISLHYANVKGYIIRPGAPNSIIFDLPRHGSIPFREQHLEVPSRSISKDFEPDRVAYDLVKFVYASFGLEASSVPFFNLEQGQFIWPA
jgi:hypothetical protein